MLRTGLSTQTNLNLKLETRIDPALILRSELVELPLLQLEQRINLELDQNPFLEATHEDDLEVKEKEEAPEEKEQEVEEIETDLNWEDVVNDFSNYEDNYPMMYDKNEEKMEFQQPVNKTLRDSLEEQIDMGDFDDQEKEVAFEIVGNLNEDGFLNCPVAEIARKFPDMIEIEVEQILGKVQHLDPVGIAARDIRECFIIQLKNKELYLEDSYIVLRDYYNDFVNKKYLRIMKRTGIDSEQMQEIIEEITSLNPKPGASRSLSDWEKADVINDEKDAITPDFYVREEDGEIKILLNDFSVPNFKINTKYSSLILNSKTEKNTKNFVKRKLESARWFINAIYQRKMTLNKVMHSIVKFQEDFFRYGPEHVNPLILKTVAEDIEMDVATVSRCTKEKYVDTDFGVFELKYFFTEKLATADGNEVSTTVVKNRIKEMIENENKKAPLSDQKISDLLKKEGHTAARRTVQKYREQLGLPKARMRKEVF